jgi:hypothetical protein
VATGESVNPPDVGEDGRTPFDDIANSSFGEEFGIEEAVLRPDDSDSAVEKGADPGGSDFFTGLLPSFVGIKFKVNPGRGISVKEIGVDMTGMATVVVG